MVVMPATRSMRSVAASRSWFSAMSVVNSSYSTASGTAKP